MNRHMVTLGRTVYHPENHDRYGAGVVIGFRASKPGTRRPASQKILVRWSMPGCRGRSDRSTWCSSRELRLTPPGSPRVSPLRPRRD